MEALLFDIGGTILDDSSANAEVMRVQQRALKEHGCDATDDQFQQVVSFLIRTFVPGLRRAVAWSFTKPDVAKCEAVMRATDARIPQIVADHPRCLYPGIGDVLASLSDGYVLALAGNAPSAIREDLERLGVLRFFVHREVSQDIGWSKPDARFFRHILDAIGTGPENAVMIGDRLDNDIIPARALGMKAVWVRQGEYAVLEPRVPKEIPEATVASVAGIPAAVATILRRA